MKFDDGSTLEVSRPGYLRIHQATEGVHDLQSVLPRWIKTWMATHARDADASYKVCARFLALPDWPELDNANTEEKKVLPPATVDISASVRASPTWIMHTFNLLSHSQQPTSI